MLDPTSTSISPLRKLGIDGQSLWDGIQNEYRIDDRGGRELLMQACEAADRVARLAARIEADGELLETKNGLKIHPAVKEELAGRQFIARVLQSLGLNLEPLGPVGRPSTWKKQQKRKEPPGADE